MQSADAFTPHNLAADILRGETQAETALYEQFAARVYFTALSETHSPHDAEDIRAETFLRVIQALRQGKLRTADSLPSFIVGITLNVTREHLRRKYRADSLEDYEYDIAGDGSLEQAMLEAETGRALQACLRQLKPREQECLRLFYYEELTKEEIAERLGINEERVRLVKSRALASFREIYKKMTKPK